FRSCLPIELNFSCAESLSAIRMSVEREGSYCEKGYISQPIPIATSRKARNAHRVYFTRSVVPRLERNAKVRDTTSAKNNSAPKWLRLPNKTFILLRPLARYHMLRAR